MATATVTPPTATTVTQPNPNPAPPAVVVPAAPQAPGVNILADNMAGYQPIGVTGTTGTEILGSESLVEDRLAKLYSQENESPLMKAARLSAGQQANAMGLGNSTQAIQAGQQAMILQGLDIVRQDAQNNAQAALNEQTTLNQGALNTQAAGQAYQDANQKGKITGALNQQQGQIQTNMAAFQAAIAGASAQQQAQITNQQKLIDMRFQEAMAERQLSTQARANLSSLYATASASLASNIQAIQTNPDLDGTTKDADGKTAKERAILALQNAFYTDMSTAAAFVGVPLTFI